MQILVLLSVGIHYFDFYNPEHKKLDTFFGGLSADCGK